MSAADPRFTIAVELAGRLLATEPAAVDRVLARHHRRPDGRCTACGPAAPWPCFVLRAAREAQRLAPRSSAGAVTPPTRSGRVPTPRRVPGRPRR